MLKGFWVKNSTVLLNKYCLALIMGFNLRWSINIPRIHLVFIAHRHAIINNSIIVFFLRLCMNDLNFRSTIRPFVSILQKLIFLTELSMINIRFTWCLFFLFCHYVCKKKQKLNCKEKISKENEIINCYIYFKEN